MKLGWCAPLELAKMIQDTNYDFIELPLATLNLEEPASFQAALKAHQALHFTPYAFNVFLPRDMVVVGKAKNIARYKTYLARAAELMQAAGASIIVYGSGWSRNLYEGVSRNEQRDDFLQALHDAAQALEGTGITLVIEPLNKKESDLINSVAEGVAFAKEINHPKIQVLADFYHMDEENEPFETLITHSKWLKHIHLADTNRDVPGSGKYDYDAFFNALKTANYQGAMSVEIPGFNTQEKMQAALPFLKAKWGHP